MKYTSMIRGAFIVILLQLTLIQCALADQLPAKSEIIELNGEWDFYWDTLLSPQQLKFTELQPSKITVPSSWTESGYPADGKATYRLLIDVPANDANLALLVPKIWSNSKVWINGKLVSEKGDLRMVDSRNNMILEVLTMPIRRASQWDIVVQVANKDIYLGGLLYPFEMGPFPKLNGEKKSREAMQTLWLGALLVMGIYHLILFLIGRAHVIYLLIAGITFLLALKMMVFGENLAYQWLKEMDRLDFKWQSSLYYFTTYMVAGLGGLYINKLYPNVGRAVIGKVLCAVITVYGFFVLAAPIHIYTPTLLPFQVVVGLTVFYIITIIFLGVRAHKSLTANTLQLLGILVMILAAMNDGLYEYGFKTGLPQEVLPYGFMVVIFIQMIILAYERYQSHQKILELVDTLEHTVERRTRIIGNQKKELQDKSEELGAINAMKDKYFVNISHDLRSPLAVVLGNFDLIKLDQVRLADSTQNYFDQAEQGARVLSRLIDQITHLIRIKTNGIQLNKASHDLSQLIWEQLRIHQASVLQKQIAVNFRPPEVPVKIFVDSEQFFRVVQNLLTNAIEHTQVEGRIEIVISQSSDQVNMQIMNSGALISEELQQRIFERFFSDKSARSKGMGVGLELTRELVELHGGTIRVKTVNDLNCFEVTIPKG